MCKLGGRCLIGFSCTRLGSVPPTKLAYSITEIQERNKKNINEYIDEWMWVAQIKLLLYVFMYIHMYTCILMCHRFWSVKCQTQFSRSIWTGGLPPPVNELCTREHEARHSKTLADFAVPDNTAPPPHPNLDLFGCWHCRHDSDGCQMSWNVPAEYTLQHGHHIHALTLSTLALFEFDGEKNNQLQIKWSARQHIYTS